MKMNTILVALGSAQPRKDAPSSMCNTNDYPHPATIQTKVLQWEPERSSVCTSRGAEQDALYLYHFQYHSLSLMSLLNPRWRFRSSAQRRRQSSARLAARC